VFDPAAPQAADFDKSTNRERKSRSRQNVMPPKVALGTGSNDAAVWCNEPDHLQEEHGWTAEISLAHASVCRCPEKWAMRSANPVY
jgi:hypothetical protein